jgi:fatty-acyl-CoA synthase
VFGLCTALAAMAAGAPLVMQPAWDAGEAARAIDAHGVTHINATDEALAQLLAQNDRVPAFPSLVFTAFGAFNPALADIVARGDARGMKMVGLYGTSEIQALFARQDASGSIAERSLAGGLPVSPNARVRARDPESGRVLEHGEAGELEFFAPDSCMLEYFGDAGATRAALDDGWYRSGDLGYTLADGRFVFVTRLGDSLRLGGFLVSPLEIEAAVQEVAGVRACQVVAVEVQGKLRPVAFVIMESPVELDEGAVTAHVEKKLAKYKVPARVFAIDAFPTTPGANATKIQKHKLRELALSRMKSD